MARFTAADLTAIDDAIKSGALSVRYQDGRQITYRSTDELIRTRDLMNSEIATDAGSRRRRTFRLQQSGTGL
jgi:hypothetical protein